MGIEVDDLDIIAFGAPPPPESLALYVKMESAVLRRKLSHRSL